MYSNQQQNGKTSFIQNLFLRRSNFLEISAKMAEIPHNFTGIPKPGVSPTSLKNNVLCINFLIGNKYCSEQPTQNGDIYISMTKMP
jgi:hypothetical protein